MDGLKKVRKNWLKFYKDFLPKTITKIKDRYMTIIQKISSPGDGKMGDIPLKLKDDKNIKNFNEKITTAEEALSTVKPGDCANLKMISKRDL
ncbi:hypothetical protein ACFL0M_09705 [Thermodesulfobacteriota bacterium]